MSDSVHLLVPFAHAAADGCAQALRGLRLPHFERLLARLAVESTDAGDPHSLSTPHERALARAHALPPVEGLIPFAALQAAQAGAAGAVDEGWAWVSPGHWRVGRDRVAMAQPADLQLEAAESQALLAAMQPYFAEDGITLAYDAPMRWLARGALFRTLPTASLDRVVGRTIDPWMPAGEAGRPLRRLQQEMQMLLYTLPLNDARQRSGRLPVNSVWVSGTGALPAGYAPQAPADLQVASSLRDAALLGDWTAWAGAWQELDASEGARLLQAAEGGREVRVTLCGEASARTWSSRGAGLWRRMSARFGAKPVATAVEDL